MLLEELQLLLELREKINRNAYGHWIDPQNRIHEVSIYGHDEWAKHNVPAAENLPSASGYAIDTGYVRLVHPYQVRVGVEGTREAITRVAPLIIPSIGQKDMTTLHVDVVIGDNMKPHVFLLPNDRIKAIKF